MCNFLFGSKIDRNLWLEKSIEMSNKLSQSQTLKWILIYIRVSMHFVCTSDSKQILSVSLCFLNLKSCFSFLSEWKEMNYCWSRCQGKYLLIQIQYFMLTSYLNFTNWTVENPFKLDSNSKWSLMLCLKRKRDIEKCFLTLRIHFSYHSLALIGILFLRETE